jgi:hypothetical protein
MPIKLKEKSLDDMKKDAISSSVDARGYKKGGMVKKPAAKKPMGYAKGGMAFKPCAGCPNAAKCKAMGKCMAKSKK